jgi:hypothetical protein
MVITVRPCVYAARPLFRVTDFFVRVPPPSVLRPRMGAEQHKSKQGIIFHLVSHHNIDKKDAREEKSGWRNCTLI